MYCAAGDENEGDLPDGCYPRSYVVCVCVGGKRFAAFWFHKFKQIIVLRSFEPSSYEFKTGLAVSCVFPFAK